MQIACKSQQRMQATQGERVQNACKLQQKCMQTAAKCMQAAACRLQQSGACKLQQQIACLLKQFVAAAHANRSRKPQSCGSLRVLRVRRATGKGEATVGPPGGPPPPPPLRRPGGPPWGPPEVGGRDGGGRDGRMQAKCERKTKPLSAHQHGLQQQQQQQQQLLRNAKTFALQETPTQNTGTNSSSSNSSSSNSNASSNNSRRSNSSSSIPTRRRTNGMTLGVGRDTQSPLLPQRREVLAALSVGGPLWSPPSWSEGGPKTRQSCWCCCCCCCCCCLG